jgi:hypothetical protein
VRPATLAGLSVLGALAACMYPEKEFDGPYSCLGAPPPTSADMLVTLQGLIVNPSDLMPLAGVSVTLQDRNMSTISGPSTTDASGGFRFSLNTNGTPVDGVYLNAAASGRVTTYYAPARPVTEDLQIGGFAVLSTMQSQSLALGALGMPFATGSGAVLLTINDCNNKPLDGATLTSAPAGQIRYFQGIQPSMTATATDAGGVAMVANLPPGDVTLTATVDGMRLPSRSFKVVSNAFVVTIIKP